MMKSEFEARIGHEIDPSIYKDIEYVYNYHPSDLDKDEAAKLYMMFGPLIFEVMRTQERILTAWCEDLENEGRSISEWLDIRCTAAALMDEDLKRYALHSVGAFLWLMPYWKGNESNLFLESFNPYRYGRQGIK